VSQLATTAHHSEAQMLTTFMHISSILIPNNLISTDHHIEKTTDIKNTKLVIERVGSVTTIITEMLQEVRVCMHATCCVHCTLNTAYILYTLNAVTSCVAHLCILCYAVPRCTIVDIQRLHY
jgi:hypothetical protein